MTEKKKTMLFAGVAIVLALLAFATAPRTAKPDTFYDLGEEFFPEFKDPNTATSLEVITFNEETGEAIPFKVEFKNGKWTIPSHHDYPADGENCRRCYRSKERRHPQRQRRRSRSLRRNRPVG